MNTAEQDAAGEAVPAERMVRVMELARRLSAARSPHAFAELLEHAAAELGGAERARCLYYDAATHALWKSSGEDVEEHSAAHGISGSAVRHGAAVFVGETKRDPRWKKSIDDPEGDGTEQICALPIIDPDRHIHAVVAV